MKLDDRLERRVHQIGEEIFEYADAARLRIWEKAWWLEQATHMLDFDDRLRVRVFQFVDCLPALATAHSIMRHIEEYFGDPSLPIPGFVRPLFRPGLAYHWRSETIGALARFGATKMAGRFITGYDVPSALKTIERLRRHGMAFTVDVLGEFTNSHAAAERYAGVYHQLLALLPPVASEWPERVTIDRDRNGPMPRVNLSIKLTGLDPHFDPVDPQRALADVGHRLRPLLRHARRVGAFVNIDMESTKHRGITLELFKQVLIEDEFRDWTDVGIVLQAYLRDAEHDLTDLLAWRERRGSDFTIRLVKGAYWDAEIAAAVRDYREPPVWTKKWESDACFERMTHVLFEHADRIRPAIASHNIRSLAVALATAERFGVSPQAYEVQTLFGMGDALKAAMVRMGQCVRVYCPYGDLMPGMGYLIRRLLENTSNEGFLKQSFADRGSHARLLANPATTRPPSTALPTRHYQNTDPEKPMLMFKNATNTNFAHAERREKMRAALDYVRGEFGRTYPLMINGKSVSTQAWFDSVNPSHTAQIVGQVARATAKDVGCAVGAARDAFTLWRLHRAADRAQLLRRVADRLEMRRFEIAATMVLEVGKPWREADADVTEGIDHWRYYADQIERIEARPSLRNLPGENNLLSYYPKGVCAVIAPYAFPIAILSGMTSASLAAGNTVVMKPARQASVVAAKLVEILHDVGMPPGVVNFLPGPGATIGSNLVEHGDVNLVAFTGSADVGAGILRVGAAVRPGQGFIKKLIVEMGGQNAIIVDDDADLDAAVRAVVESAFAYAGQKCSSCSRVIVLDGIYNSFLDRLREAVSSVRIGPAENPTTMVGPLIDQEACDHVRDMIESERKSSRVLIECELPKDCEEGYFVPPTVLEDVKPDARIAQEEVFGPVLAVIKAKDFDEALGCANGTRFALTGGVFSRSPAHIDRARREFAVGNLYINRRITGSQVDAQPFGGFKLSGTGVKAGSPDYLLHFMDARCITENTQRSGLVPSAERTEVS